MDKLKSLQRHTAAFTFLLYLMCAIFAVAVGIAIGSTVTPLAGALSAMAIVLLGGILLSLSVASESIKPTEFLARAILHVSSENSTVAPPDLKSLPSGQEFFERLARIVYDNASGNKVATVDSENATATSGAMEKTLLWNSPLPIYALDKENKILFINNAGVEYGGLKDKECIGKPLYDVLSLSFAGENTLESWLAESHSERLTGSQTWDRVRLELDDNTVKQCDMAASFSKDNSDGVETIIVLFDHTARYTQDDRGASFVAMAVHELRTPLTIMRGYIEVFEDEIADKLDPEQAEFMRTMGAQAQSLSSFVNNIQNFTRIEDNQLSVEMKEDDWAAILESTLKDLEMRARVRHKTLKLEIDGTLPPVAVDHTTIKEVIINIVENSIKYTHNDEPIIIRACVKEENWVETTIEDKGIGIPTGLVGHIFDKFYRSHRSSKAVGGTGLGLYLSKAIVVAHGGQIWVKSKEGEGTTFGFTVPTAASVASELHSTDNAAIVRGAHGWIKNHSMYRG
jgi:signal transduction histidine kinase